MLPTAICDGRAILYGPFPFAAVSWQSKVILNTPFGAYPVVATTWPNELAEFPVQSVTVPNPGVGAACAVPAESAESPPSASSAALTNRAAAPLDDRFDRVWPLMRATLSHLSSTGNDTAQPGHPACSPAPACSKMRYRVQAAAPGTPANTPASVTDTDYTTGTEIPHYDNRAAQDLERADRERSWSRAGS